MRLEQQAYRIASDFCAAVPSSIQAQLTWNGIAQGWITFGTSGHNPGDVYYLPLQVASPVASSGIFAWRVAVKATFNGVVYNRSVSCILPVVVNAASGTQVNAFTFTFDADNNLLTAVNNAATTTMTYDALDRLATEQDTFGTTLTNTYDAADNRTQVQDSFGATTTRIYDVLNRIASLQLGGTGQTPLREDFTYTARDQVATQTRYSDLAGQNKIGSSTFGYDSVGRLTNLQHLDGSGTNIANYVNAFDLASRITSETLNGGTPTNYTYDVTNELTDDSLVAYNYDLNGNRTMSGYTTGLANELISDGIWNYFHDKNGNLVGKTNISTGETWSYGYDNRNRLISAIQTTSAGVQMQATYVYDALGQRIEKDVTQSGVTTTTRFAYDRREIWADLDSSDILETRYIRGEQVLELLARIASGTAAWILADRMGSVRNVLDNTGAVIDTIGYDGYGNVESDTNPANGGSYKYDGYRFDGETYWLRPDLTVARVYAPKNGGWTGRDPTGFATQEWNLYTYGLNNPVNTIDPYGLGTISQGVIRAGFGPGLVAILPGAFGNRFPNNFPIQGKAVDANLLSYNTTFFMSESVDVVFPITRTTGIKTKKDPTGTKAISSFYVRFDIANRTNDNWVGVTISLGMGLGLFFLSSQIRNLPFFGMGKRDSLQAVFGLANRFFAYLHQSTSAMRWRKGLVLPNTNVALWHVVNIPDRFGVTWIPNPNWFCPIPFIPLPVANTATFTIRITPLVAGAKRPKGDIPFLPTEKKLPNAPGYQERLPPNWIIA